VNDSSRHFIFPIHPRTRHVLDAYGIELAPTVTALPPVSYLRTLELLQKATSVVTDSGGLQKEAYWLRKPCVTLRKTTEWVDTVRVGANTLVDPDEPGSLGQALESAHFPEDAPQLYGDGHASNRIAAALYAWPPE
jgi:UDP-N-acetylglucosamine 2-epimerase